MPFGKYKGRRLADVPTGYLNWVLENCRQASPDLLMSIARVLHDAQPPETPLALPLCDQWYRTMSMRFHPDKGGNHEAMKAVNAGRELLLELVEADA